MKQLERSDSSDIVQLVVHAIAEVDRAILILKSPFSRRSASTENDLQMLVNVRTRVLVKQAVSPSLKPKRNVFGLNTRILSDLFSSPDSDIS